jgi:hypothetical protein
MLNGSVYKVLRLRNTNAKRVFHYHSSSRKQYERDPPKGIYHAKFVAVPTRLKVNENSMNNPNPFNSID